MMQKISLPIDAYLDEIHHAWALHSTLMVKASPGSGKTTRLPWKIAKESSKKVIVLEPRRLAAKLAAQRIADEEGLQLGAEVGYHFRFEKKHQPNSKLIFYTEGTFLKLLTQKSSLDEIGTVILDEFHERHLETDLALAVLRAAAVTRPDLKLIIMSATLDDKIIDHFPEAKHFNIQATQYEVEISFLPNQPSILNENLPTKIKKILKSLPMDSGDVLVFLPGMREMLNVQSHLGTDFGEVVLLHGDLSKEEQQNALIEKPKRKIILSTNIAESSITIPSIKIVIDSGIQREARYSPWTGLKNLEDRPITQSSAIQRAGRAGRTSNGKCFRLYSEQDFNNREAFTMAEILKADLTETYLLTSQFGTGLIWLTNPPEDRWLKARELLIKLGAINQEDELTMVGRRMLGTPLEPRLARSLIAGENLNLSERKRLLTFICEKIEKDSSGRLFKRLDFYLKQPGQIEFPLEKALLYGFIDQVAKLRKKQHDFIHYSGKTLKIHSSLKDLHHDYYIILDITPRQEAFFVVPIDEEWLFDIEPFPFREELELEIDQVFSLKRQTLLGSILIDENILPLDWVQCSEEVKHQILRSGEAPFQKRWREFQDTETYLRFHFWARINLYAIDEVNKSITYEDYLNAFETLSWDCLEQYFTNSLEKILPIKNLTLDLPESLKLGSKKELKIHYPFGLSPYIEAPIQDFYGLTETPKIMQGKVSLTLKLLGPHKRPIQVTQDLKSFWKKTYLEMKKEWQRDYPRHHWPENPESALPVLLKRQLI
jgi:ATP-dependent helicase HrpB